MKQNLFLKGLLVLVLSLSLKATFSQTVVNAPNVEDVWGGRINAIAGYSKSSDSVGIYIATESANSLFFTSIYNPAGSGFTFRRFRVLPSANSDANLGSGISLMDVHKESGMLFFVNNGLYSTSPTATSLTLIDNGNISNLKIRDSILIYVKGVQMHWGKINSAGTYTADAASPISIGSVPSGNLTIAINPKNYLVYLAFGGTSPSVIKTTSVFYSLGSGTTFSSLPSGTIPASTSYTGFGISPSGRLFQGGQLTSGFNSYKAFRYSDDGLTWTNVSTLVTGVTGTTMGFSGTETSYRVHFAKCYSTDQGNNWVEYGNSSYQTHPNDGAVLADPNDSFTVYMTTDQGIGYSVNGGSVMLEMDRGVEAVQVNDISMTSDKKTAWIASKAGVRKVSNYTTTKDWSRAKFPNGDGSPYYAAEMKTGDTNTVYVGNLRVYKTTDGGTNWTQKFSAENAPYSWPQTAIRIEAIEVCQWNTNIVMAGYYFQDSTKGGLFYSLDGGDTWQQQYLYASTGYNDVDIYDIIFNIEGTDTIAYVGVEYDLSYPTGRSVYKLVKSGSSWTVSQDMNGPTTSTGSLIVATIRDLYRSSTGDTIYACGTDAGVNHPIAYYKPITATGKWTPLPTSGFPMTTGEQGYAITQGVDTIYVAVENDVYYLPSPSSTWGLGYSYPVGTQINFLYYDELLVGTASGLYGHHTFEQQSSNLALTVYFQGLYTGVRTMTPAPHNSNAALSSSVADTIIVELHSATAPYAYVTSDTALLSTAGLANLSFASSTSGTSYYLVVKHRNSIETWSASPVSMNSSATYDFSTAATKAYGNNLKLMGSGIYAIYSGDINQDGTIDFSDYPSLDLGNINGSTGYRATDLNGDGTVDFSDYPLIDLNSANGVSVQQPN
ncbi:MAG: hypothetical protein CFE21_04395 [Bacteroidetes bacterium B1(2017)]|nr:MAG: hypothetical protein CFE21_04395 [Bacteroidetes bacterium B1(2017)]